MIFPDLESFEKIKDKYDKITVYREIFADTFTPISFLMHFANEENIFLLESVNVDKTFSRFSFFGINPSKIIYGIKDTTVIYENHSKTEVNTNIVQYLKDNYKKSKQFTFKEFGDFAGGLVGYFGFESVNFMNLLRQTIKMDDNVHSGFFEINDFFVYDNFKNKLFVAKCIQNSRDEYVEAVEGLKQFTFPKKIKTAYCVSSENVGFEPEYSKDEFIKKIKSLKKEIINGEAIQVVFSQKYTISEKINPFSFYRALRRINPSPYMFFLKFKDNVITGSSPETHLKINNGVALLKPIAGTYPVEKNIEEVKNRLLNDKKEMAEHLMLLDLARNDLYQGCKVESVKVKKAFITEVYSHVVHIVSEVVGEMGDNMTSFELFLRLFLLALFPVPQK